ncbi:MAG: Gfo/Idh/MocA family oxidoreductase [Caldilineaceae bacterium]|nr:Gfo/Idh/MocA family oxidoreductase [Caldilineaceae bacterium]
MITIGMIGADSTHTESYTKLVNLPGAPLYGRAQVVKLWGEDADQARTKAAQYQVPEVVSTPEAAIADVDLVMICSRYGDDHPAPARLALQAGVPTFVDKPFANDFAEVRALVQLAAEKQVPLMSCSAVRYAVEINELQTRLPSFGQLTSAVTSGPAAGDFPNPRARHPFFYGIHPVELLHTLLGPGAEAVTTRRTSRCDVGLVHYSDGRQGVINLLQKSPALYHGTVFGQEGWADITIQNWDYFYVETLNRIITMAETGAPPYPIEWAVEVMAILTGLLRSAEQGGETVVLSTL